MSTYPRRPKTEALSSAIDVVERLRDPTDQVPNARHLRDLHTFGSVTSNELLIQLSVKGELRQHDGVMTVMMKLPARASPKHCNDMTEVDYGGGGHRTRIRDQ